MDGFGAHSKSYPIANSRGCSERINVSITRYEGGENHLLVFTRPCVCPAVVLKRHDLWSESTAHLSKFESWLKEGKVEVRKLREGSRGSSPK